MLVSRYCCQWCLSVCLSICPSVCATTDKLSMRNCCNLLIIMLCWSHFGDIWLNFDLKSYNWQNLTTELIIWQSGERRIAVVQPRHDEQHNEWLQNRPRQRLANAPYLAEDSEPVGHRSGNVRPHGGVGIQVDPEICDRGCRLNEIGTYSDRCLWDLILTSARRAPEDLGLTGIQLEPVTLHPQCHLVDTRRYPLLALRCCWWCQDPYICVSSAYSCGQSWYLPTNRSKSAVYSRNRMGPKTDPCGTPRRRKVTVEEAVPRRTYCVRPSRYDWNEPSTWPRKPYDTFSRRSNVAWSTVSNAADKWSRVSTRRSPVSSARSMSASTLRTAVSVEW